tara:strand:- start:6635 stop:7078 length:444 start_codon:yes stop_codon:yes gene_type:complete
MKELLYLKDEQLKGFIEKIFITYRESFNDPKNILKKYQLGTAHHKSLHLISFYEGITISQMLKKLNVTKQSLNRVLNDLKKLNFLEFKKGTDDTRVKHLFLSDKGKKVYNEIFGSQKKRIYKAFLNSSAKEVLNFDIVLKRILDGKQ